MDGRFLTLLALAGIAGAKAVRGSQGLVRRTWRSDEPVLCELWLTFKDLRALEQFEAGLPPRSGALSGKNLATRLRRLIGTYLGPNKVVSTRHGPVLEPPSLTFVFEVPSRAECQALRREVTSRYGVALRDVGRVKDWTLESFDGSRGVIRAARTIPPTPVSAYLWIDFKDAQALDAFGDGMKMPIWQLIAKYVEDGTIKTRKRYPGMNGGNLVVSFAIRNQERLDELSDEIQRTLGEHLLQAGARTWTLRLDPPAEGSAGIVRSSRRLTEQQQEAKAGCDFEPDGEPRCGAPITDIGRWPGGKIAARSCGHHAAVLASDHPDISWRPAWDVGSAGIVRASSKTNADLVPSEDPVDHWPERFAIQTDKLSLIIAVGAKRDARPSGKNNPNAWDIFTLDSGGPNRAVVEEIGSKPSLNAIGRLFVFGEHGGAWWNPQRDDAAAHGRKIDGKAMDDLDAAVLALRRGFNLVRIPDSLTEPYYRWYLLHPLPSDQTWFPAAATRSPLVEAERQFHQALSTARPLPPGLTLSWPKPSRKPNDR